MPLNFGFGGLRMVLDKMWKCHCSKNTRIHLHSSCRTCSKYLMMITKFKSNCLYETWSLNILYKWFLAANPIAQDELSSCCLFSLSPKIQPKNILSAQLWVHLRPADMVTTVFLQISRLKPGKEGNNTRVRVRSLKVDTDTGAGSWQSIDIKSLLQAWLRQPETNYGIEINAFDSKGEDLAVTSAEPGEEGLVSTWSLVFTGYLWYIGSHVGETLSFGWNISKIRHRPKGNNV